MLLNIATMLLVCFLPISVLGIVLFINQEPENVVKWHKQLIAALILIALVTICVLGVVFWEISQITNNLYRL